MNKRYAILILVTLILLPGCPGAGSNLVGTWVFSVGNNDFGVTLMPNGEATSFLINSVLVGTLTWHTHGDQFVMDQVGSNNTRVIYSGLISNDGTVLDGARVVWTGINQGLGFAFTGAKT